MGIGGYFCDFGLFCVYPYLRFASLVLFCQYPFKLLLEQSPRTKTCYQYNRLKPLTSIVTADLSKSLLLVCSCFCVASIPLATGLVSCIVLFALLLYFLCILPRCMIRIIVEARA